ncbi:MAG: hypothetical protein IJZ66_01510, partial [Oscillibacter sp.]|nr:hypothetical protein [Oscillibacter sp.]
MKPERKRFWLGGLCGLAVMLTCALVLELLGAGLRGQFHWPVLVSHGAVECFGSYPLAVAAQSALCFGLGAMVGISTMPFDEDGQKLLVNSLLHFGVTAALSTLLLVSCLDIPAQSL